MDNLFGRVIKEGRLLLFPRRDVPIAIRGLRHVVHYCQHFLINSSMVQNRGPAITITEVPSCNGVIVLQPVIGLPKIGEERGICKLKRVGQPKANHHRLLVGGSVGPTAIFAAIRTHIRFCAQSNIWRT